MQRVYSGQNNNPTAARPREADRNVAGLVQSNSLVAKAKLISDMRRLFDTVPSFKAPRSFAWDLRRAH
jgi:hypothetical protein